MVGPRTRALSLHLDGMLVGPAMVALARKGILDSCRTARSI